MNNELLKEITLQRDSVLEDIFERDRIKDFTEEDKDELYAAVIIELLYDYASSEYFEYPEEFIDDLMRNIHDGVNPYAENTEDEED